MATIKKQDADWLAVDEDGKVKAWGSNAVEVAFIKAQMAEQFLIIEPTDDVEGQETRFDAEVQAGMLLGLKTVRSACVIEDEDGLFRVRYQTIEV